MHRTLLTCLFVQHCNQMIVSHLRGGVPFRYVGLCIIILVGNFLYQLHIVAYLLFRYFFSLL